MLKQKKEFKISTLWLLILTAIAIIVSVAGGILFLKQLTITNDTIIVKIICTIVGCIGLGAALINVTFSAINVIAIIMAINENRNKVYTVKFFLGAPVGQKCISFKMWAANMILTIIILLLIAITFIL